MNTRTEWGFRDNRTMSYVGPVSEEHARDAVSELDDVTLVRRTVLEYPWEVTS